MIVSETLFVDKRPVGRLFMDTLTQDIAFQTMDGSNSFPDRNWSSVDEPRQAVEETYSRKNEDSAVATGLLDLKNLRRGSQPE